MIASYHAWMVANTQRRVLLLAGRLNLAADE